MKNGLLNIGAVMTLIGIIMASLITLSAFAYLVAECIKRI